MTKILICFDGTGNEMGDAEDDSLSNIAKIAIRAGWMGNEKESAVPGQSVLYYPGPGTRGGFFLRLIRKLFSPEITIRRIIREAEKDLNAVYTAGDEIIIIGFSRGAAIARRFAAMLGTKEVCPKHAIDSVELMICFDTVAQIGKPDGSRYPDDNVVFENHAVSSVIRKGYHLVSIDEHRRLFPVTLMDHKSGDRVTEVWFKGVHSDVGGGYPEHGLSDVTLEYAVDKLQNAEIEVRYSLATSELPEDIDDEDIAFSPDISAPVHYHKYGRAPREIHIINDGKLAHGLKPLIHRSVVTAKQNADYQPALNIENYQIEEE